MHSEYCIKDSFVFTDNIQAVYVILTIHLCSFNDYFIYTCSTSENNRWADSLYRSYLPFSTNLVCMKLFLSSHNIGRIQFRQCDVEEDWCDFIEKPFGPIMPIGNVLKVKVVRWCQPSQLL